MKIGIIGIAHPFISQYKALKKLNYEIILCDIDKDKLKNFKEEKYLDYKELATKVDIVLISTPPINHFEIIKYFLERDIKVISEKPIVTNKKDFQELKQLINNNFYNILHFSFGEEILYFKEKSKEKPIKIEAYINDSYIENNHIKKESLSLHGSYLDETINPLSAICRLYGTSIKHISTKKKYYEQDEFDYSSISKFIVNDIPVTINVNWNDSNNREKYIDLYFKERIIRLDSYNVQIIDLTNDKILFKSKNIRMDMHYINGLKNIDFSKKDLDFSMRINEVILEGSDV